MAVVIPGAGQVGNIYTVPQSDWSAINKRVATVIEVQGIASVISQYIKNYDQLLSACQQWKSTTLPGLITQSVQASLFSTNAAKTLSNLQGDLRSLQPGDPVPQSVSFIFSVEFQAIQQDADPLICSSGALTPQIANFVQQNRAADAVLEQYIDELGPDWQGIEGPITSLESAMTDVSSGWSTVQQAFAAAAGSQPDLTTAELLGLDVQSAIDSWNATATGAAAFNGNVSG